MQNFWMRKNNPVNLKDSYWLVLQNTRQKSLLKNKSKKMLFWNALEKEHMKHTICMIWLIWNFQQLKKKIDEMKRSSGYNAMHSEISEEITFSKLTYM